MSREDELTQQPARPPRGDSPSIALVPGGPSRPARQTSDQVAETLPQSLGQMLEAEVVRSGAAPGSTAGIARRVGGVWRWAVGAAGNTDPFNGDRVTTDTWYDLASLTKSMTALTVARAVEGGRMQWDARLSEYLPLLAGTFGGAASLLSLLSHRAGFVAHMQLRDASVEALQALAQARRDDLAAEGDGNGVEPHAPLYSDVGYILAGLALEQVTGSDLDIWLHSELAAMANAGTTTGNEPTWPNELASARQMTTRRVPITQVAPTEVVATRGGLIRGQVHDDNAWTASETSTSGHAGMFGTVRGVLGMAMFLLDAVAGRSSALSSPTVETLLAPRGNGSLRAGFDSKDPHGLSVVGRVLGQHTFGHLGFTGTSYWCDPDTETAVVLLTNRVCPSRDNLQLRAVRPGIHDALANMALNLLTRV